MDTQGDGKDQTFTFIYVESLDGGKTESNNAHSCNTGIPTLRNHDGSAMSPNFFLKVDTVNTPNWNESQAPH